jgi:hypothetical protein
LFGGIVCIRYEANRERLGNLVASASWLWLIGSSNPLNSKSADAEM